MRHNGFLYGHYDSRGGSMFIVAQTRDEADRKYAKVSGFDEDADADAWAEDFIGAATLDTPAEEDPVDGGDLEWGTFGVFASPKGEENEFLDDSGPFELIQASENPDPSRFCHPRWDDDAFCLLFIA